MQLTPRSLLLALAAILVSGIVFGAVTSLAPSITPTTDSADPSQTPSAIIESFSPEELGDAEITVPSPSASTGTSASTPELAPTPARTATITPTPTPTITPTPASASAKRPTARPSTAASSSPGAAKRPVAQSAGRPGQEGTLARPTRPTRRAAVVGGWQAPTLGVGSVRLSGPRLSSGAPVSVTVLCAPRAACAISGDQLVINADATSVTVTWSAPARAGYTAWRVSRAL